MRIDLGETETDAYVKARRSTNKLLVALHCHHDARMTVPEGWVKPEKKEPSPEFKELWFAMEGDDEPEPRKPPRICDIQSAVAKHYGVTVEDIISDRRDAKTVFPRHVGMYLARMLTTRSHSYISGKFGWRDHSVAIYAVNKIKALVQSDWMIAHDVAHLEAMF